MGFSGLSCLLPTEGKAAINEIGAKESAKKVKGAGRPGTF